MRNHENVALIGLGPHAQRVYYPYLDKLTAKDRHFSFELIIDLEHNREKVEAFLADKHLQPIPSSILTRKSK